jgi:hypothetical protein
MSFSLFWFFPPVILTIIVIIMALVVASDKTRRISGILLAGIFFAGAIRGIVFKQMSGRGCPTLRGDDAAIYGAVLLVLGIIITYFSFRKNIK